jgi:hypothetical protein
MIPYFALGMYNGILCRPHRDAHLVAISIDYVLVHTGFMGSYKLSSFDGCQVG